VPWPVATSSYLLSYRDDETHKAVRGLLAALDRERLATELRVPPLGLAELGLMLQAILGADRPAPPEVLDQLYALTEGNPFFVEEALQALVADGQLAYVGGSWKHTPGGTLRIPRSVQDAVQRRAEQLGAEARQLLSLCAVAGRRFDLA
jgi:predicted ATPase